MTHYKGFSDPDPDGLETNMEASSHSPVPLVFATDSRYVQGLLAALRSLATHLTEPDQVGIYVIHTSLKSSDVDVIGRVARDCNLTVDFLRAHLDNYDLRVDQWISPAAYLRLLIPELLPSCASALYVDSDVLFLRDVKPLLETRLSAAALVGAVRDVPNPTLGSGVALPGWKVLGLDPDREYFNSGVMLVNSKIWREERVTERAIAFVTDHRSHVRYWDQDALNYVAQDRWDRLPLVWNHPPLSALLKLPGAHYHAEHICPLRDLIKGEPHAALLHFMGPTKPWSPAFPAGWALDKWRSA
jgi:lipopolysaccharide biosynthesis glycosyltransferase